MKVSLLWTRKFSYVVGTLGMRKSKASRRVSNWVQSLSGSLLGQKCVRAVALRRRTKALLSRNELRVQVIDQKLKAARSNFAAF